MKPKKPDHICSRNAFIATAICVLIGAMGYEDGTLSGISMLAIIPIYILPTYGIIRRRKEKKAFAEEVKRYEEKMKIQAEQERRKKELMFGMEALDLSVKYLPSPATKEIAAWLMTHFAAEFSAANRGSYVEDIKIQLSFDVSMNSVTCRSSTYSFIEKRYASVPTRLEKAALARALGVALQSAISLKYREDLSGTKYTVNVKYMDHQAPWVDEPYSTVMLIYEAENGNFVSAKQW